MAARDPREVARETYADCLLAQGPAWRNTADLIRTGWENIWITPALDAMVQLMLRPVDGDDEEEDQP